MSRIKNAIVASIVCTCWLAAPTWAAPDVSSWLKIQSHNIQQAPGWLDNQAANLRQNMQQQTNRTNTTTTTTTTSGGGYSLNDGLSTVHNEAGSLGQLVDHGARKVGQEWFSFINFCENFLSHSGQEWDNFSIALKHGANHVLTELSSLLAWLQAHVQQLKSQTS